MGINFTMKMDISNIYFLKATYVSCKLHKMWKHEKFRNNQGHDITKLKKLYLQNEKTKSNLVE